MQVKCYEDDCHETICNDDAHDNDNDDYGDDEDDDGMMTNNNTSLTETCISSYMITFIYFVQ